MDDPTIDLATAEQLIDELMRRPNLVGIVIGVATDVTGEQPHKGAPVECRASRKLSAFNQARALATAIRKILDDEAERQNRGQ
jgi:hypothetical protein